MSAQDAPAEISAPASSDTSTSSDAEASAEAVVATSTQTIDVKDDDKDAVDQEGKNADNQAEVAEPDAGSDANSDEADSNNEASQSSVVIEEPTTSTSDNNEASKANSGTKAVDTSSNQAQKSEPQSQTQSQSDNTQPPLGKFYISYAITNDTYYMRDSLGQDVKLTFTKINGPAGDLAIEEIHLSDEDQEKLGSASKVAYDITSSMKNGSFEYDLSISAPDSDETALSQVEPEGFGLVYASSVDELDDAKAVKSLKNTEETVEARGLDHFTVFVVVHKHVMANNLSEVSGDTSKWFFYNDENDTINSDGGSFVEGPAPAPAGRGSAKISVTGNKRTNLGTVQFGGTKLSDINTLKFSTYNPSADNDGDSNRSGYLLFNIDFDGSDTWQSRLNYVPSENGAVIQDSWQEWDAIDGGSAKWRYSGSNWPTTGEPGETLKTWSQILADYPDAQILPSDPHLGIRVGEPYSKYTEYVDKFVFGVNGEGTLVFDFEKGSDNDTNKAKGWAYVEQISKGPGTTDLKFVSTRNFYSCFEYRADDEANTIPGSNPNAFVTDGRWNQVCVNNSESTKTISAVDHVDVRMVYGAESDERFGWTRFDVDPIVLQAPISLGYNTNDGHTNSGNVPTTLPCVGAVTNVNGVSMVWEDNNNSYPNLKYQRQYQLNNAGSWSKRVYSDTNTGFSSFGGGGGTEMTVTSQLRAFIDLNGDDNVSPGEPVSEWSNSCDITYDKTAPSVANIHLSPLITTEEGNPDTTGGEVTVTFDVIEEGVGVDLTKSYVIFADGPNTENQHKESAKFTFIHDSGNTYHVVIDTEQFVKPGFSGLYNLQFTLVDLAGNRVSVKPLAYRPILIDNEGPSVPTILSPNEDDSFNTHPILNDWSDATDPSGIKQYEVEYIFTPFGGSPQTIERTTTISSRNHTNPLEGSFKFKVRAIDGLGNEGAWSEWRTYYYDKTAPQIANINVDPLVSVDTTKATGGTTTITFDIIENGVGIDFDPLKTFVRFFNGPATPDLLQRSVRYPVEHVSGDTYRVVVDTTTFVSPGYSGLYNIRFVATDLSGNETNIIPNEFKRTLVDNEGPDAPEILFPDEDQVFRSGPILNDWDDVTDQSGIDHYRIEYEYDDGHSFQDMPYRTTEASERQHTPSVGEQGGVRFRVQAFDGLGNEGAWSEWRHYYYDAEAPVTPTILGFIDPELACGDITNVHTITVDWTDSTDVGVGLSGYNYKIDYPLADGSGRGVWNSFFTNSQYMGTLNEGLHKIQVQAKDKSDLVSEWSNICEITADFTAPVVQITNLTEGQLVSGSVPIEGFVKDKNLSHYWLNISGPNGYSAGPGTVNSDSIDDPTQLYTWDTTGLEDGEYTVTLAARDKADNQDSGSIDAVKVQLDNTAPNVEITNPSWGKFINGNIFILGLIKDLHLSHYWLKIAGPNGYIGGHPSPVYPGGPFNTPTNLFDWNVTGLLDGEYTITLQAWDLISNQDGGSIQAIKIKLDKTPPTSSITPPESATQVDEQTVTLNDWDGTISGTSSDNLSGVKKVWLSIENDQGKFWNGSVWADGTEETVRIEIPTSGDWSYAMSPAPDSGTYTLKSHAEDNAGNVENTATLIIIYDSIIPEVSLSINPTEPDGKRHWYVSEPTITLTASDLNEIEKIEYQWNSQTGTWLTYTGPVKSSQGNNRFYYRSVDKAGNISEVGIKTVLFDNESPENPETMKVKRDGHTAVVSWSEASDNNGVHGYKIKLNHKTEDLSRSESVGSNIREFTFNDIEDGEWLVTIQTEDLAGWTNSRSQDMTVGGLVGEISGVIDEIKDSIVTPLVANFTGSVLGVSDKDKDQASEEVADDGESLGEAKQLRGLEAEGAEGQVAGVSSECNSWRYYLPILLLVAQLLLLLGIELSLKSATMPKIIMEVVVTAGAILLVHFFSNYACYVGGAWREGATEGGSLLILLKVWFWPISIVLTVGVRALSAVLLKED